MGLHRLPTALAVTLAILTFSGLAAAETKIGFVDQRKAMFSSREGKQAEQRFSEIVEQRSSTLRPLRDDLQRLQEEFEKQKYVLSDEALQERRIDILRRQRELERDAKELDEDLQIEQVKLVQPIQKRVQAAVAEIGKEQNLTLIVDKSMVGLLYLKIEQIRELLPHREPMLLVDRVVEVTPDTIVAEKLVSVNEPHFRGHFPERPIMPGVLIVEALAQAAGIHILWHYPELRGRSLALVGIDKARFRRPVVPGDVLRLTITDATRRGDLWRCSGSATVQGERAAEAEFMAAFVDWEGGP
jgi:3-hydroxyacyl-[acyl-carrier-protein] dehydratase